MSDTNNRLFSRRGVLASIGALACGALVLRGRSIGGRQAHAADAETFEVHHTEAEWRTMLTPAQYSVLRDEGTERAFTSPLDHETRKGVFACAGCNLDLYSSDTKFDSRTGWPSFWQPLPNAVNQRIDTTLGMQRDEVHCRRCGGHLGHVFDDGPRPTGLRYCMNGVAMQFTAASA
ncbi:MAG: peptide-methionine (R)-S-oxide reductase MsrB [Rudaea sp.]